MKKKQTFDILLCLSSLFILLNILQQTLFAGEKLDVIGLGISIPVLLYYAYKVLASNKKG